MLQTTIANTASAGGVGLHTGVFGHIRLVPAPADAGIVFRRVDLDNFPIEAEGHNVARVSYATSLMKQGVLLSTTEHLLAAIYSYGIDNVYIDIDSIEVPILDGSFPKKSPHLYAKHAWFFGGTKSVFFRLYGVPT